MQLSSASICNISPPSHRSYVLLKPALLFAIIVIYRRCITNNNTIYIVCFWSRDVIICMREPLSEEVYVNLVLELPLQTHAAGSVGLHRLHTHSHAASHVLFFSEPILHLSVSCDIKFDLNILLS